jgi:hypothetical protein
MMDEARYQRLYPYYAEVSALTEIRKSRASGVKLRSGIGGHSLLYLHGVCLDRTQRYPVLTLCAPDGAPHDGVGISVNSHYKNANWNAVEGRAFLWQGALEPGELVTRAAYEKTQRQAKAMGVLDGIEFHEHLFADKPAGMSDRDYKYEISIATDYGARFGRDILRALVPLDRHRMARVVAYLNDLNEPYRAGRKLYRWRVVNDNCSHLTHNVLAAAGVWSPWPTGQFAAIAAFGFPVPKNEFVDLMQRSNDLPIADVDAVYADAGARETLLQDNTLPTAHGALAIAERAIGGEAYDTRNLRLIFYDNPFWGAYRRRLARILGTPRYTDLRTNLQYFAAQYAQAQNRLAADRAKPCSSERAQFNARYAHYVAREAATVNRHLTLLDQPVRCPAEAVS